MIGIKNSVAKFTYTEVSYNINFNNIKLSITNTEVFLKLSCYNFQ